MNDPHITESWRPSHPDPALADPPPPGLRSHRHPPNRLHAWVFRQHQVWVDAYGNEWETDALPSGYARAIIAFCQQQAARIRGMVTIERLAEALLFQRDGNYDAADAIADQILADAAGTPAEFLERTPLFGALRRRLEQQPPRPRPDEE